MKKSLIAFAILARAFVAAAADIPQLKDSVVRVTTAESDGAGIVVGADQRTVFIATASHVVPMSHVDVQFNAARHRTFAGRVFRQSEAVDFAVVSVDVSPDDPIRHSLRSIEYREGPVALLTTVSNIGHASKQWEANFGVNKLQSEELNILGFSKLGVVQGASGGPLFDDGNRLIGMVTEIDAARATALKIDAVVSLLSSWNVQLSLLEKWKPDCDVHVQTSPAGAMVRVGEKNLGIAPLSVRVPSGDTLTATFTKDGYKSSMRQLDCGSPQVDVSLEPLTVSIVNFVDHFDDDRNHWYRREDSDAPSMVKDGVYVFGSKWGEWQVGANLFSVDERSDFTIRCKFTKTGGVDQMFYGLVWGFEDMNNFFNLAITADGHVAVTMKEGGQFTDFIDTSVEHPSINKGNAKNRLMIQKRGRLLRFFVNDQPVHEMESRPFFGQRIGFIVYNYVQLEIDDLEIQQGVGVTRSRVK